MIPEASADFVCQMEAVLAVYQRAYDSKNPVVNLDESLRQLVSQVRSSFTDSRGVVHQDYEYCREGVAQMYMIVEALAGRREVLIEANHNRLTYAKVIAYIVEQMYPAAEKITLIEDNLSHRGAVLTNSQPYTKYLSLQELVISSKK